MCGLTVKHFCWTHQPWWAGSTVEVLFSNWDTNRSCLALNLKPALSQRAERIQEVCSASACYCSLITEPNCLIRSETTIKLQCYTAPGQSLSQWRAVFLCYLGTGGSAQLCKSPVAWLPAALLQCRRTQCLVSCVTCSSKPGWGGEAAGSEREWRRRLFASLQHLESLWIMWEHLGGQCGYCI